MGIPKIIKKKDKDKIYTYKFIKQCNENLFLYEEINLHYKECFNKHDLGIRTIQMKVTHVSPEKVKIKEDTKE